jgi:FtsZ-binding cell division protein ZapB
MRMNEEIILSIKEYEKLKMEIERLKKENQKLRRDNEVSIEVLDYISKGAEQVIKEWGNDIE